MSPHLLVLCFQILLNLQLISYLLRVKANNFFVLQVIVLLIFLNMMLSNVIQQIHDVNNLILIYFFATLQVDGVITSMKRKDLGDGEIHISHSGIIDRWLVIRKILDASNVSVQVSLSMAKM